MSRSLVQQRIALLTVLNVKSPLAVRNRALMSGYRLNADIILAKLEVRV